MSEFLTWLVYTGALEGRKLRRNRDIVVRLAWKRDLAALARDLQGIGLVL